MNILTESLKKPFNYDGRLERRPYWINTLLLTFLSFVVYGAAILATVFLAAGEGSKDAASIPVLVAQLANLYFSLASINLLVKRLHDVGKSGYWFFACLIPILGFFALLYFTLKKGDLGPNDFGGPGDLNPPSGKRKNSQNFTLLKNTFQKNITDNGLSEARVVEILVEKGYDYNEIIEAREEYKKAS